MDVSIASGPPEVLSSPLLAVPVASEAAHDFGAELNALDRAVGGLLSRAIRAGDFPGCGRARLFGYWTEADGPDRVLFLGVGPAESLGRDCVRDAAGTAVRMAEDLGLDAVSLTLSCLGAEVTPARMQAAVEGLILASWRYGELRSGDTPKRVESARIVGCQPDASDRSAELGRALAVGENLARTLQARPGNVATPRHLAEQAELVAEEVGLECEILGPSQMRSEGMDALLSVSRGSDQEPRLIVLKHHGGTPGEAPLVLVGKGLTFDAGGISIKPAKGMEDMKYDMSGGAAVLGAMRAIGELGLPVNVTGVVPSSENLLNGSATKPGDVINSRAGKTIEVINTDAEGRLILADALHYACDWTPAAIVDCATLTGACVVALGHHRSAVLGSDEALVEELERAGERASQPIWRLPLDRAYREQLDSEVADLKNVGGRPGGTITAACFLAEFVGDTPWAHLDIAGTAYGKASKAYQRDGPTGNPCRLLAEWVISRAGI